MNAVSTVIAIGGLAIVLFGLERCFPLRTSTRTLVARLVVNVAISALAFVAAITLVRPAAHWTIHWSAAKPFGLVHVVALPKWAEFALSFLLMDLAFYYWHLANHRVPFLWRFHNAHHIDPDLDVSTAFRFHFGEIAFSAVFTVLQVGFIGLSAWEFAVYQLAFQAEVIFHHSNLRMPIGFERLLSKVIVTPRMHGIHHSQVRRENNSNFGTVFSWWDRIHRTLGLNIPQHSVTVGIPAYTKPEDNRVSSSLLMPFRKQRDYWRRDDGMIVDRTDSLADKPSSYLAE